MWFDPAVVESVVESLPLWAAFLALLLSYLGSIYIIVPVTIAVYLRGKTKWAATWPAIVIAAYALFVFLKPLSGIERPGVESPLADVSLPIVIDQLHHLAIDFDTESFPSGHAIAATVFYGLLVVDTDIGTWWLRASGAAVMLLGVFFSRVALGVHYVGDVVGGAILGLLFFGLLLWLREQVKNPAETLLVIPVVLAGGALLAGRPLDAVGLLIATGGFYLVHTQYGETLRSRFSSRAHSSSVSEQ